MTWIHHEYRCDTYGGMDRSGIERCTKRKHIDIHTHDESSQSKMIWCVQWICLAVAEQEQNDVVNVSLFVPLLSSLYATFWLLCDTIHSALRKLVACIKFDWKQRCAHRITPVYDVSYSFKCNPLQMNNSKSETKNTFLLSMQNYENKVNSTYTHLVHWLSSLIFIVSFMKIAYPL